MDTRINFTFEGVGVRVGSHYPGSSDVKIFREVRQKTYDFNFLVTGTPKLPVSLEV